jgi:ribosome maturation protein Sdo1
MELILKTNNESSIAKIIALAKKLNVTIEQRGKVIESKKEELSKRILNFKANETSSFGDAAEWQCNERQDRATLRRQRL